MEPWVRRRNHIKATISKRQDGHDRRGERKTFFSRSHVMRGDGGKATEKKVKMKGRRIRRERNLVRKR